MTTMTPISQESTVVATGQQIFSELDKEAIILDMPSGVYYGLNQVGKSIWQLIQEPCSVQSIVSSLLQTYPTISAEACEQDVVELLTDLQSHNLIELK